MTLASRAFAAMFRLPPARTRQVAVRRDVPVPAPGGVTLLTDVYLSGSGGPQPAILIRSPYGRRGTYGVLARVLAERGYHVAAQSTRGTGGSGGEIDFDAEAADGRAAADWVISQPWSNGELGGYGASYLSFTQLALASTRPPQLKAVAVDVWAADRRAGYFPGGSFALERALTWTYLMSSQGSQLRAMVRAKKALAPAFAHLPILTADEVAAGRAVPFYRAWVGHDAPGDPSWAATDFRAVLPELGIPVAMQAGWYDMFLPYMLADYRALRDAGRPVRLRVGGWPHGSRRSAGYSLRDALAHFGTHLRHQPAPAAAPVQVEVMGGGGWRELPDWPPPARTERWHLQPGGALAPAPPPESAPDRYRYDPADPTPAVGGSGLMINAGPADNRALEQRPDVLTYTSGPLASALEIIGPVAAELHVTSSLEHTDFFVRLCDVHPRGRSVNITDGLVRLRPGDPRPVRVDLWPTAHRFAPGHRIRLQVSSGAHPRYARNPGTAEPLATATTLRAAEQAVHHDPGRPSSVFLPVTTAP